MSACILQSEPLGLTLAGAGAPPEVRQLRFGAPVRRDNLIQETLELALEGSGDLTAPLRLAEAVLARARQGQTAYLLRSGPGGALYRSPLRGGWLETLTPATYSLGARLALLREDYWEGQPTSVPLSNPHGATDAGLTVDFRADQSGSANWCQVLLDPDVSPLPAPACLEVANDQPGALPLGDLYVSAAPGQDSTLNLHLLEAESGMAGEGVDLLIGQSASRSGGAYMRCVWSGAGPRRIITWSLPHLLQAQLAGHPLRPLLLLPGAPPAPLWLHWRMASLNGGLLGESEPALLDGVSAAVAPAAAVLPGGQGGGLLQQPFGTVGGRGRWRERRAVRPGRAPAAARALVQPLPGARRFTRRLDAGRRPARPGAWSTPATPPAGSAATLTARGLPR